MAFLDRFRKDKRRKQALDAPVTPVSVVEPYAFLAPYPYSLDDGPNPLKDEDISTGDTTPYDAEPRPWAEGADDVNTPVSYYDSSSSDSSSSSSYDSSSYDSSSSDSGSSYSGGSDF